MFFKALLLFPAEIFDGPSLPGALTSNITLPPPSKKTDNITLPPPSANAAWSVDQISSVGLYCTRYPSTLTEWGKEKGERF